MAPYPSITLALLGTLVVSAGAQSTNWVPKAPPRAYTARVQMHYVPLHEAKQERDELHAYEMPTDMVRKGGLRTLEALNQQPAALPQAVVRSGRKDDARNKDALPKEKTGVRALLADDDDKRPGKESPWEGLDGREMSRRMAEREWRIAHPGETPAKELAKTESEREDLDAAADREAFQPWRTETGYDRDGLRADVIARAEPASPYESSADRFSRIAQDFVSGGAGDVGALRPSDFEEVARRFEDLQKNSGFASARVAEAAPLEHAPLLRSEPAVSPAAAWGDSGFRSMREGALMPGADFARPAQGFGSGFSQGGFNWQSGAGSGFAQPEATTRGLQSGAADFKKNSALPW